MVEDSFCFFSFMKIFTRYTAGFSSRVEENDMKINTTSIRVESSSLRNRKRNFFNLKVLPDAEVVQMSLLSRFNKTTLRIINYLHSNSFSMHQCGKAFSVTLEVCNIFHFFQCNRIYAKVYVVFVIVHLNRNLWQTENCFHLRDLLLDELLLMYVHVVLFTVINATNYATIIFQRDFNVFA